MGDVDAGADRQRDAVDAQDDAGVAVRIGIIAEDVDQDGHVLGRRCGVRIRHRHDIEDRIGETDRLGLAARLAVAGDDGDLVDTVASRASLARIRREPAGNDAGTGIVGQARRQAGHRIGQRIAFRIDEIAADVEIDDIAVVAGRVGDRRRRRRIVDHGDVDGDDRGGEAALAVADPVGDRIRTVIVGVRRIGQRAVGIDHDAPVRRARGDHRERIAVRGTVTVIAEHVDGDGRVLVGRRGVVPGDRRRIGDREGLRRRDAEAARVGRGEGERIDAPGAALAGIGGEPARHRSGRRVEGQARRQAADERIGQRRIVDIGEEFGDAIADRRTIGAMLWRQRAGRLAGHGIDDRGIIGAGHRDRQRRSVAVGAIGVADEIHDRRDAGFAGLQVLEGRAGVEGIGPVRVDRECAAGRPGQRHRRALGDVDAAGADHPDRIAVRVAVIEKDIALDERPVLRHGRRIVVRGRRRIGEAPGERLADRAAMAVARRHGDRIDAVVVRAALARIGRHLAVIGIQRDDAGRRIVAQEGRQARYRIGQRVMVGIGEEGLHVERDPGLAVAVDLVGDLGGDRRIVDRHHGDDHLRRREAAIAVGDPVADDVGAVEVRIGRIGDGAVGREGDGAVAGGRADQLQRVAVGIDIGPGAAEPAGGAGAGQHVEARRHVLVGRDGVVMG